MPALHGFDWNQLLLWIILAPMFGAILNGTIGRGDKKMVRMTAIGVVAISFICAVISFVRLVQATHAGGEEAEHARLLFTAYDWFNVQFGMDKIPVRVAFTMDQLSGIMTVMVTGIGLLIHIFATSYMSEDPSYHRFFAYLNLFTASMLILVLGSSMPLMFVGWEGVGLCSYLLIGFWWENPAYAAAGKKAFIVNRIGDFGVLIGMFILVSVSNSFEFSDIREHAASLMGPMVLGPGGQTLGITAATTACLFLFLGCSGKSAQIPLYIWLPDAMAGPTPVSALIHAATMVTSGVYLIVRLSPVFMMAPGAMATIAVIGACTAFMAATIGLVQNQMKKILAYSTVSQLGFMFAGVGVGAFAGGFFHVFTHAFFKACLFLGAGSVMHAVHAHGDADIRELGGMRKFMPRTHATFLISCLAIAGFPLFSGFFSKDDILLGALFMGTGAWPAFPQWVGWFVFITLAISACMTAFYMFRLYFVTFWGEYRGGPAHEEHGDAHAVKHDDHAAAADHTAHDHAANAQDDHAHDADHAHDDHSHDDHAHDDHGHSHLPHESDAWITIPLMVLATGAIFVGFLGLPAWLGLPNIWEHWLEPITESLPLKEGAEITKGLGAAAMGVGTFVGLFGIWLAYSFYVVGEGATPKKIVEAYPKIHSFLMDKWRVDEFYGATVIRGSQWLSRFSSEFDRLFIDGLLAKATSAAVEGGSWLLTRAQNGVIAAYTATMILGLAGMTIWFIKPHACVDVKVDGEKATLTAGKGLGYEYRWDTASDGDFDGEWSATNNEVTASYRKSDIKRAVVMLDEAWRPGTPTIEIPVGSREWTVLDSALLGGSDAWHTGNNILPPAMRWQDGKLLLRRNGAFLNRDGATDESEQVELAPGARVDIGLAHIFVSAGVRATVEVRNSFGYVSRKSINISLKTPPTTEEHAALGREGGAQ